MKTVWQRMEELLDAGALGEPAEGSAPRPAPAGGASQEPRRPRRRAGRGCAADVGERGHQGAGHAGHGRAGAGRPLDRASRGAASWPAWCWWPPRATRREPPCWCRATSSATASVVKKLNAVLGQPVIGHNVKEAMRSLLPLGIDLTGLAMDTAVAAYLLDASTGEYELQQLREQTGQLSLDIVEPGRGGPRRGRGGGGRGDRRRQHGGGLPQAHRQRAHDHAARRDRDPARPRPGQDGGRRHRHRPGRAAGDRRLAWPRRPPPCRTRCRSWPATSST